MKTNETFRTLGATLALAGAVWAPAAAAEERTNLLENRFTASLGTYFINTDTEIAVNGSAGQRGTIIDLERDTGLNDSNRFRFDGLWRINDRHHIRVLYFDANRDGSKTLDKQLVIGDTTYPLNATLNAQFDATIFEVAYEYAFLRRESYEVSASIGAHALKFESKFFGNGSVNGRPLSGATESSDTNAPLPVLGLRGMWRFADNWYADLQGQWFSVKLDAIDGSLSDIRAGVTWMFMDHVGLGAGWNRFAVDVDASKRSFSGSLDWQYSGAQVYVTGAF